MALKTRHITRLNDPLKGILCFLVFLSSCTIVKKYQKGKPFVAGNSIEVKEGNFNSDERNALKSRLNAQLDDSSKVTVIDKYFIRHIIDKPPAYDSSSAALSVSNMEASMLHIGYYRSQASFTADTVHQGDQQRVYVHYTMLTGKPTLIDTVMYVLRRPDLQELAMKHMDKTFFKEKTPITKAAVLGEINRLVELYRNNGYYKFTAEELKVRGDTTIEALTTISDDPFEQLRLLAEAKQKQDSPTIKLAVVLNTPADSSRLKQFTIGNVYVLPDYQPGDSLNDPTYMPQRVSRSTGAIVRFHKRLFRTGFLLRNMFVKKGDLYNQENFYKTLNSFSKAGVWQSVNIQVIERKDSAYLIDLVIQLIPGKKYAFEAAIEASYSATSNTNNATAVSAGNLLGLSGNVSIQNRNVHKEAIKMTNALRAGVELNLKPDSAGKKDIINSNEITYSNTIIFPRFIFPFRRLDTAKINGVRKFLNSESFINTNLSYVNRINLFKLQSVNFAIGYDWSTKSTNKWVIKPLNIEFARLYNETDSFKRTLDENPFLRYSFNTALVAGSSVSYTNIITNRKHPNRQNTIKINVEESGFPLGVVPLRALGVINKYLRQFAKADIEYVHSVSYKKSAFVFRLFGGIGVASKQDTTLPFFKQYFGGGANSMRGWPIRGIGRGSQPLVPFSSKRFNDRTGDMQLEANVEYRFNIAQLIPNSLVLKGALFVDAGNIWNLRNSKPGGGNDSAQFKFKNLYKELGVDAGAGFRLDFNYFVVRFDLGFRFKRPELSYINDGWKLPSLSFNDLIPKLFGRGKNEEYRKWRYENFNFTVGISYPF